MVYEWVKDELKDAGRNQRELAQAWGVSEGAVSRWMAGTERKDLPLSRFVILANMLGMSLDDLARRLGALGKQAQNVATTAVTARSKEIPLTSQMTMDLSSGKARVLLHLDLPLDVATQVMTIIGKATKDA